MGGLSGRDSTRAAALKSSLGTLTLGGPSAMSWATQGLCELLDTDKAVTCSYEPCGDGLRLGESWSSGMPDDFFPTLDVWLRDKFVGWTAYHPLRPEPTQRNVIWDWTNLQSKMGDVEAMPIVQGIYKPFGLDRIEQVRTLVCEGPSLLMWMGFFQSSPYEERQRRLLAAVTPALQQRLAAERWLAAQGTLCGVLEAALDAIPSCAFVVTASGVVRESNAAGRAWLAEDSARSADVRAAAQGRGDPAQFTITHVDGGGNGAQRLLVHRGRNDAGPRVAVAAARWGFTRRQTELLALLVDGQSNRVIAAILAISERTVETHLTAMFDRAQVEGRAELVAGVWRA